MYGLVTHVIFSFNISWPKFYTHFSFPYYVLPSQSHVILLYLIIPTILYEEYKLYNSSMYFLLPSVTCSFLLTNNLLRSCRKAIQMDVRDNKHVSKQANPLISSFVGVCKETYNPAQNSR
jgi:hypothetical protein